MGHHSEYSGQTTSLEKQDWRQEGASVPFPLWQRPTRASLFYLGNTLFHVATTSNAPLSEHGGCLQQKCLGKLLIFLDGFLRALCSALAACEVPFPRLHLLLESGFVLTSLMPPPPAALPLHSSSREQTHLESCTSFASVRWHVCPRFVDSRFVTLTSCNRSNPTRDSSTLSHIPQKG